MAKEKLIITSDCRFDGKNHAKGSIIERDWDNKEEAKQIALLNHAGRIGQATPDNIRSIQAELKAEQAATATATTRLRAA